MIKMKRIIMTLLIGMFLISLTTASLTSILDKEYKEDLTKSEWTEIKCDEITCKGQLFVTENNKTRTWDINFRRPKDDIDIEKLRDERIEKIMQRYEKNPPQKEDNFIIKLASGFIDFIKRIIK